ncbi:hypothetical protein PV416_35405 [Streptomyces ipomoeae]|uniref:Uncharacterized protein n=1 Tax=Streptomyces ipomoeae 91-03 TaxID=698759 RepID=L1KPD9_9ACTN|nr:hypothetical protein [Streptomyces ipomoeae]EKX62419.1 hypothetical protein STRIP9103_02474 [Streptomyces ipomoeae 91-03]MDX2698856.1 hypothetical protein [Streptomyces ipomoeae]MDX2826216.1 hypothetical protein [Streptomyces ipomoeae]MDX2844489.1 hypothetical protein [Streptomyces ipomoeae]MDX2878879.1 hypothetical protein [Streptomyces ipomoeae]
MTWGRPSGRTVEIQNSSASAGDASVGDASAPGQAGAVAAGSL